MEWAEIIGVICAAFVLVVPLTILHRGTPGGIGGEILSAPQAGLMALIARGVVGGNMTWPIVIVGMLFAVGLIMLNTPSPMIIAVGMYLPYPTTFAIFAGGMIAWILNKQVERRKASKEQESKARNTGLLLASGLVAGEALTGVLVAAMYILQTEGGLAWLKFPAISDSPYPGFLVFLVLGYVLVKYPLKEMLQSPARSIIAE